MNRHHASTSAAHARHRGFTLVEMLVVIGIIAVLAGIALVAISKGYGTAQRVRAQADLQVLAIGLEAYKQDFGDYPRPAPAASATDPNSATTFDGAALLAWALAGVYDAAVVNPNPLAPPDRIQGDGADGNGFRSRVGGQGKVYGPYVDLSSFELSPPDPVTGFRYLRSKVVLSAARDGIPAAPILYIPAAPQASIQHGPLTPGNYLGRDVKPATRYRYDISQCDRFLTSGSYTIPAADANGRDTLGQLRTMVGDLSVNGQINAGETPACNEPFMLWIPGEDGRFGASYENGQYITDDVANFEFGGNVKQR